MRFRLFLLAGALLTACTSPDRPAETPAATPAPPATPPVASVPDTAAGYAFLRQTIRLSFGDAYDVRASDEWFFSRYPYPLNERVAGKLAASRYTIKDSTGKTVSVIPGFPDTPAPVIEEFRRQIERIDTALQRRLTWDPARLGQFVFVEGTKNKLLPALAGQVRGVTPAQQASIRKAIEEWNRGPQSERFISYASLPLFSADGRYALVVRGQSQQSIGWDSIFIYQRTATGWKILDTTSISTI